MNHIIQKENLSPLSTRKSALKQASFVSSARQIHKDENIVFSGPVKIEDRALALKGEIMLKDRFAVLCSNRLLLFKSEKEGR